MNLLRSLVDAGDGKNRLAAGLYALAAILGTVPLAAIALVLLGAASGTLPAQRVLLRIAIVVLAAMIVEIPLLAAATRLVRAGLERGAERLRVEVVEHLRRVPARTLAALDPGQTLATFTLGLDESLAAASDAFGALFVGLLQALFGLAVVAAIDWRIALVALAFVPVAAGYLRQSRRISARATPRLVRAQAEGSSRFHEYVESLALLRAFGCTSLRLERLTLAIAELNVKAFENVIAPLTFGVVALFFIEFGFAITMMIGVELGGNAAGARYILALTLALAYFQSLFGALDGYLRLRDAAAALRAIEWLLALPAPAGTTGEVPERHDLALEGIGFSYDRGPVLHDVSFRFPERALTAIVGASGAGKSALASVIAGVWDPSDGTVRVGGIDLAGLDPAARARTVGIVFQETHLIEETIARNIAAGRPAATREEILAAGRIARCDEFVERLPDGYDSVIRADGTDLSLGERQRIAIARMLLSEAPVVVLDECTASLDPAAERAVLGAIEALAHRKTVVLITHRMAAVRGAARIAVLAHGTIVESGTHEELARNGGEYARLWSAHEDLRRWKVAG